MFHLIKAVYIIHTHTHYVNVSLHFCHLRFFFHFVALFISSCSLIIFVVSQLVGQSASLSLPLSLTGPPVSKSTPLDPESLSSFLTLTIYSLPVNHNFVMLRDRYMWVCVYGCTAVSLSLTICVCPYMRVCGNALWRHDQSSTANLTQLMKNTQASSMWEWT